MHTGVCNELCKLICRSLTVFCQVEMGGEDAFGLRVVNRPGFLESGNDIFIERLIFRNIFAKHVTGFHDQLRGMRIKSRSD